MYIGEVISGGHESSGGDKTGSSEPFPREGAHYSQGGLLGRGDSCDGAAVENEV
jgi:hypothetical protein